MNVFWGLMIPFFWNDPGGGLCFLYEKGTESAGAKRVSWFCGGRDGGGFGMVPFDSGNGYEC